ncbi:pilus assembly protein PilP [Pelagovum pacificum]|uniref:Pilus assembly protein PilP n=1 Tax=Pelagovum pacificum TaxID=2588711 RepID=A0A5C5GE29_9RHOB|nr:pilus assembly protein PilP [Pelagovum pacificum]QQA44111.1 hypothetical protein I8N54_05910 [Pelagovum pacificum]TNY32760.1 pilus assembly protein PilP [Pelagovum pacificum]
MEEQTNETVASAATDSGAIDTRDTILVGLITSADGPRAMLRYPEGTIDTVAPGDLTQAGRVVAIDQVQVVLQGQRGQRILTMPRG